MIKQLSFSSDKDFYLLIPWQRENSSNSNSVSSRDNVIAMQIRTRYESSTIRILRQTA